MMIAASKKKKTIICTPLTFYTTNDEEVFFLWLSRIGSIHHIKGVGRELHLDFKTNNIPGSDLLDLMGIFDRYRFLNPKQLEYFKNETNKEWFD